ncbi:hypothetical protein Tco_1541201 [Tanacetum coccineum]
MYNDNISTSLLGHLKYRNDSRDEVNLEEKIKKEIYSSEITQIWAKQFSTSGIRACEETLIKKNFEHPISLQNTEDMRQYIAITDHILWDIIINGDQATTEPASSSGQPSAPKTSIIVNARRNNEKSLNILLSAIPDRHLLSFHDDQDAQSLWAAIKARFGGNKESKKMQKNLLKQQFETFVVGAREELDSAYDRFQNIISMLELYDAKVSYEDANLKFLRSLPSVCYEHEFKGASSSNSQNEIICSFFAQQASMPETHDDEDLLQFMMMLMEEMTTDGKPLWIFGQDGLAFLTGKRKAIWHQFHLAFMATSLTESS